MPEIRALSFLWPAMLGLLAVLPLLVAFYLRGGARRTHTGQDYPGLAIPVSRHHVPAILLLAGLGALIIAVARPQALVVLPARSDAIILAMDASGSMRATDVKPSRLVAAQDAARRFIAEQPSQVRIGVVSMAASAALVQSPTDKREDIIAAIERVQLQPGSALGSGLVIALVTLLPESGIDAQRIISGSSASSHTRDWLRQAEVHNFKPVPPGSDGSTAIVLFSDGESNTGPDLLEAGKLAAERGVRVFTVGIGTIEGAVLSVDGWSMRVRMDEEKLRKLASMTHGEYFRAGSAAELKDVYKLLSGRLALGKGRETEITAVFVALGAALAAIAALTALFRSNRIL